MHSGVVSGPAFLLDPVALAVQSAGIERQFLELPADISYSIGYQVPLKTQLPKCRNIELSCRLGQQIAISCASKKLSTIILLVQVES